MSDAPHSDAVLAPGALAKLRADATRALQGGQPAEAARLLREALAGDATPDAAAWVNLAAVLRAAGDATSALAALDSALALDARYFLAHLMRGSLLERSGDTNGAAQAYGIALTLAPPVDRVDGSVRTALQRAREVHQRYIAGLGAFIRDDLRLPPAGSAMTSEQRRINAFIDGTLGVKPLYRQQPSDFEYPGLPAIGFYERNHFPWLEELEANTDTIRSELLGILSDEQRFEPYIRYPSGVPLDQWRDLNDSRRWSAFHFYHYGRRYEDNCARCPNTVALLERLPQPVVPGRMPAAMFSVLRPHTRIPPHTGVANVRLVVHLPLIVPEGCGFRVGDETRAWREGEAWVFDDTIEHEAWNHSDDDRVVLIFDIWSPFLNERERALLSGVMTALDKYQGTEIRSDL